MSDKRGNMYEATRKGVSESTEQLLASLTSRRDTERELEQEAVAGGKNGQLTHMPAADKNSSKTLDKHLDGPAEAFCAMGNKSQLVDESTEVPIRKKIDDDKERLKLQLAAGKRVESQESAIGQIKKGVKKAFNGLGRT